MELNAQYVLSVSVWHVPVLIIGVVAFIVALARPIPGRTRGLLVSGALIVVLTTLASAAWSLSIPTIVSNLDDFETYERLYLIMGLILGVLQAVGIGLLVAAAVANRVPPGGNPPMAGPPQGGPSYAGPPQGYQPGYGPPPGYQPGPWDQSGQPPPGQWGPPPGSPG